MIVVYALRISVVCCLCLYVAGGGLVSERQIDTADIAEGVVRYDKGTLRF